jgi:hypothetical protein
MSIDYWVDRLEDPFEMFALLHVLRSLGALADEPESSRAERDGWWGRLDQVLVRGRRA